MNIERTRQIKMLLLRCKALKENMIRTLNDTTTIERGRYSSFKTYTEEYGHLAYQVSNLIDLSNEKIRVYDINHMGNWANTV